MAGITAKLEAVYVPKSDKDEPKSKQIRANSQVDALRLAQRLCPRGYYLSDIYSAKGYIVWSKGPGWLKGTQELFRR